MKLLLHACCAPCLIYPLEVLRQEGFEVEAYFYNPNIYPQEEFLKRRAAFLDFVRAQNLRAHTQEYNDVDYTSAVTQSQRPEGPGLASHSQSQRPKRCVSCWHLRLERTARFARENNFSYFTTALLVSPYQDLEAIKNIGEKASAAHNVGFLYRDFRAGFRQAHNKARAQGIYCQKYCGCKYSLEERQAQKKCKI